MAGTPDSDYYVAGMVLLEEEQHFYDSNGVLKAKKVIRPPNSRSLQCQRWDYGLSTPCGSVRVDCV